MIGLWHVLPYKLGSPCLPWISITLTARVLTRVLTPEEFDDYLAS